VDVASFDARICGFDGSHHERSWGEKIYQHRTFLGLADHFLGQNQAPHIALVGLRDLEWLVEKVKDRHGTGGAALGEPRSVFEGVHRGTPYRNPGGFDLLPKT